MRLKIRHHSDYFHQITRYLKAKHTEHQIEDRIKEDASNYKLKNDTLYFKDTGIQVIMDKALFDQVIEAIHKDLGHYGKKTTLDRVANRYIKVATNIWRDRSSELDSYIPGQLYKTSPAPSTKQTAMIHRYEQR